MAQPTVDDKQWSNYQKWSANTTLTLCNVPWDNEYRNTYGFESQEELDEYIDSIPNAPITKFSLAKFNRDVMVDTPINAAMKFNYIRAQNPPMPIPGDVPKTYYYFVNGYEYIGPKNTRLSLQLDVWATFILDITLGRCYIDQGHVGIANQNQFDQYGRSYLTVPEGLDTGNEYRIVHKERTKVMDVAGLVNADPGYDVLVVANLDLTQPPGDLSNPGFNTSHGGNWQGLPSGASFYLFPTGRDLQRFMNAYSSKPWITQGIVSITLIPNMSRYVPNYDYGTNLGTGSGGPNGPDTGGFDMYEATKVFVGDRPLPKETKNLVAWRDSAFIANILGPQYASLKKFLTYPYMVIELTAHNGSPVLLRPEAWQDPDATIRELAAFMPPGQRVAMYPARYNADAETLSSTQTDNLYASGGAVLVDDNGDALDISVFIDAFPTLPIVNNMGIAYLAQNKNGIAFSFQNASWNQQRVRMGGQASADVASAQIGNTARQSGIANRQASQQAAIGANAEANQFAVRSAVNAVGQLTETGGSIVGAGSDALSTGIRANANLDAANAGIQARGESAVSDIQTAGSIRDTNQDFVNRSAAGDYANEIAGIQARKQDAQLTQPSVSGQFGGDAFNLIQGLSGYVLTWKMPSVAYLRQIGNHWLRYGYGVQQYLTPPKNFKCMTKFTYWRMTEATIASGNIPEGFKAIIRGIFERGVTVWDNPADIATVALSDNKPLSGIAY